MKISDSEILKKLVRQLQSHRKATLHPHEVSILGCDEKYARLSDKLKEKLWASVNDRTYTITGEYFDSCDPDFLPIWKRNPKRR